MKKRMWTKTVRSLAMVLLAALMMVGGMTGSAFAATASLDDTWEGLAYSKTGILYEATTDTVLFEKDADVQRAPASMTKVMTAIIVLEQNPNLEGEFTVDERAVSGAYCSYMEIDRLKAGEVISFEDCMNYMLIPSANEAATALAFEVGGGDFFAFVDMMNEKAKELGCENTEFQDPSGLSPHMTTARDMLKIVKYAMTFDKFREIVGKGQGTVPVSNMRDESFDYYTTNYLAFPDDRYECELTPYIKGVKTGSTTAAGGCFAGCMERDGLVFYSVVMGGERQEYIDGKRGIQGEFLDTINLYRMTDGLTKEDLEAMHGPAVWLIVVIIAVCIIAAAAVFLAVRGKKRHMETGEKKNA